MKEEFLMKARTFDLAKWQRGKITLGGGYVSEKLDGRRCFWDGGVSRGVLKRLVGWANCDKDERYVEEEVATGLWSSNGNVIHAPDSWLDYMPAICLDGELYGDMPRQQLMSITASKHPNSWDGVFLYTFDSPPLSYIAESRTLNTQCFKGQIFPILDGKNLPVVVPFRRMAFKDVVGLLKGIDSPSVRVVEQIQLSYDEDSAYSEMLEMAAEVVAEGGEGVMWRGEYSRYVTSRSWGVVKLKPTEDAEGVVIGRSMGKGRLCGMMGSLRLKDRVSGVEFDLSGFTDSQRTYHEKLFPDGTLITYKYRGRTMSGKPMEARYLRRRSDDE